MQSVNSIISVVWSLEPGLDAIWITCLSWRCQRLWGLASWAWFFNSNMLICHLRHDWPCSWSLCLHSASMQASVTGWLDGADDVSSQTAAANRWNGKLSVTKCLWTGTHPCAIPAILLSCSLRLSHGRIVPEGAHVAALAYTGNSAHMWFLSHSAPRK